MSNDRRASASASRICPACTRAVALMKHPWASAISQPRGRAISIKAVQCSRAASRSPLTIRVIFANVPSIESVSSASASRPQASSVRASSTGRPSHAACQAARIRHRSTGGGEAAMRGGDPCLGDRGCLQRRFAISSASRRASSSGGIPAACRRPWRDSPRPSRSVLPVRAHVRLAVRSRRVAWAWPRRRRLRRAGRRPPVACRRRARGRVRAARLRPRRDRVVARRAPGAGTTLRSAGLRVRGRSAPRHGVWRPWLRCAPAQCAGDAGRRARGRRALPRTGRRHRRAGAPALPPAGSRTALRRSAGARA